MDIAITLCLGQANAIRQALQHWRPDAPRPSIHHLAAESMRDTVARMAQVAGQVLHEAWEDLDAGRVKDAETAGMVLARLLHTVGETVELLERHTGNMRLAGLTVPDMTALEQTREEMARHSERFRQGWPMPSPEQADGCAPAEDERAAGEELVFELGGGD